MNFPFSTADKDMRNFTLNMCPTRFPAYETCSNTRLLDSMQERQQRAFHDFNKHNNQFHIKFQQNKPE